MYFFHTPPRIQEAQVDRSHRVSACNTCHVVLGTAWAALNKVQAAVCGCVGGTGVEQDFPFAFDLK